MPGLLPRTIQRLIGTLVVGVTACQSPDQPTAASRPASAPPPTATPAPQLVEQALGNSGFFVSLPSTYRLRSTDAADFLVYYFAPADTTVRTQFTGGLYLGGHPQGMDSTAAGCQMRRVATTLLGRPATWQVQRCATGYTLNAVFDSHSGQGWSPLINAFGEAKSAAELRQLLAIFATLRQQRPPAGKVPR
ncbi:hypothetical protein [Hymenobacter negativus]|uniref:DUF4136 domain-containing protein n=1 Tax=Hymenobacter negativus TaxID=2795026 RepID=A0ABS3QC20_9BACT|nr:hypothetical protein [Hymenobacter negativus]MBO2008801.1 hypothetical protein [Hymenobacter negativus]